MNRSRWTGGGLVFALVAVSVGSSDDPPAKDPKPTTIVVRSVDPPPPADAKRKASFVREYGLTHADFERLQALDGLKHLIPLRILPSEARYLDQTCAGRVVATTASYAEFHALALAAGRFLKDDKDEADNKNVANVVVLGAGVAKELFPSDDPVGKTIAVRQGRYTVVGVLKARTPQKIGDQAEDFDKDMYIPFATARARFGETVFIRKGDARTGEKVQLHQILVRPTDPDRVQAVAESIRELLKKHHDKPDWDVTVR